jgi:hypothetical protein
MRLFYATWTRNNAFDDGPPRLFVSVDVEEEFNWSRPFSRTGYTVRSPLRLERLERLCWRFGIRPIYFVDFAVMTSAEAVARIRQSLEAGRCILGAHLHPWVTPPYEETISHRTSFPGNLPADLERKKLETLMARLEECFGIRPVYYRAGRYGIGPSSFGNMAQFGIRFDMSCLSGADLRFKDGPDFRLVEPVPYTVRAPNDIIEIPVTRGYVGMASKHGRHFEALIERPAAQKLLVGAALRRLGILDRIALCPEANSVDDQIALTRRLLDLGVRCFSLSLHSTSLVPNATPYTRNEAEVDRLCERIEGYLNCFFEQLSGVPADAQHLLNASGGRLRGDEGGRKELVVA